MKKTFALLLSIIIMFTYSINAFATNKICFNLEESNEYNLLSDIAFINEANITYMQIDEEIYEITLTRKNEEYTSTTPLEKNVSNKYELGVVECAKIIAFSEEEKNEIIENLNSVRGSYDMGGTESFLGESCSISIRIYYSSKSAGMKTYYRINSVVTSATVRNGTYIENMELITACIGSEYHNGPGFYAREEITVTTSSYTYTGMANYPYIAEGSALGATFWVTAKRSSGETATSNISANIFLNADLTNE